MQDGLSSYSNPKLDFTFSYPKSFITFVNDQNTVPVTYFSGSVRTPDVPINARGAGFDFQTYDQNTMLVNISSYQNPNKLELLDFFGIVYNSKGVDGKTTLISILKGGITTTNIPLQNSYVFVGTLGETPSKRVFFAYKDKVYELTLFGGNNTGESYTKEAEKIYDNIVNSIKFTH